MSLLYVFIKKKSSQNNGHKATGQLLMRTCPGAVVFTLRSVLPMAAHNVGPANASSLSGTDAPALQLLWADLARAQCQAGHCDKAQSQDQLLHWEEVWDLAVQFGLLTMLTPLQGPCQHAEGELATLGSPSLGSLWTIKTDKQHTVKTCKCWHQH